MRDRVIGRSENLHGERIQTLVRLETDLSRWRWGPARRPPQLAVRSGQAFKIGRGTCDVGDDFALCCIGVARHDGFERGRVVIP
ncbi:MAG: hypothetical protein JWR79_125, partial [Tardiphaga sp.]|nr:hypothetical protein [Tardiphaga sp.]